MRMPRRVLVTGAAALALVAGAALQAIAADDYWIAPAGNLTVFGKGYGHGRGMSQYGAQGAALAGLGSAQILDFYYPGTTPATAAGTIRVYLTADTSPGVYVRPATGLRARSLRTGTTWLLPVSSAITGWIISPYGDQQTRISYYRTTTHSWVLWKTMAGMAEFYGPPVTRLVLPTGAEVPYRGTLRAADRPGEDLDTLNVLPLNDYLRGVVPKEAITSWKPAALQSQAVAARTYAARKRALAGDADFDLCDTVACQVYGGYAAEASSTNDAVVATSNLIRTYGDSPILAEFSSSNGGWTAPGGVAYLPAKSDPYDAYPGNGNPNSNWTISLDRAATEAKFGVGTVKEILVSQRNGYGTWGGRVLQADVIGTTGSKTYSGDALRLLLGLKSAWFAVDHSAITKRWIAIGGASSPVGSQTGYEWPVRGGTGQAFSTGHIYWTSAYGAWEIYGGFESRFQQIGGPDHLLGLPIAARSGGSVTGSLVQRFRNGRMFYAAAIGTSREVYGRIYTAYYGTGLEGGRLGLPTSYQYPVQFSSTAGAQQVFQGGYINWYASTNATAVIYTS